MRLTPLYLLLPLAACTTAAAGPPATSAPPGICNGESLPSFIGQEATQELGERMLAASGARVIRWVAKGMMVTMDYSDQRVTVYLDGANRVERASCG